MNDARKLAHAGVLMMIIGCGSDEDVEGGVDAGDGGDGGP